jgi:integrase
MPSLVVNALREWQLQCPKGDLDLVFPSGAGKVESHSNVAQRGFGPIQRRAGVVISIEGIERPKYGLHSLRHGCASLWIESGMNAKRIQTLMGHSRITLTYDRYGHWFHDDVADQKAAEDIQFRLLGK